MMVWQGENCKKRLSTGTWNFHASVETDVIQDKHLRDSTAFFHPLILEGVEMEGVEARNFATFHKEAAWVGQRL